jgi:phospholipid/cholesterol/gamma-HCH transport system ATP-binding protein
MTTVRRVADRVIMLSPLAKLSPGESQMTFAGTKDEAFESEDPRVKRFVRGESGMFSTE